MKVALVTTPPSVRSGIGDYTRHLVPYLRDHCQVDVYVEHGVDDELWGSEQARLAVDLDPREYDQVLYQLGNEHNHAFMPRMIRAIGGTAMQHDWVLFDLACKAWPGLVRGGAKGHALALRYGGLKQARIYGRNWLDRRRQRNVPPQYVDPERIPGRVLGGWHAAEPDGRWTADRASIRIPATGVTLVTVGLRISAGRRVSLQQRGQVLGEYAGGECSGRPADGNEPVLEIATRGIRVTREQRSHGDARRLGCFVERIAWQDAQGEHELDLSEPAAVPIVPVSLSRDRFNLPLNRSVVRHADAFIVHSRHVRDLILVERNVHTAVGIVHHGAEERWRDDDRRQTRLDMGLGPEWKDCFLVSSFGGVQPHKRIDKALRALALARKERPQIRMVLAGSTDGDFDPRGMSRLLGIEDAVHFTGFVPEEEAWHWLHAGNVALNLRGPSSGGTSGGIFQAFSMSRFVIASNAAEQKELPDACVIKVPLGDGEVETVARTLIELCDDPARCAALEEATRRFVREECHWGITAKKYAEYLESFPKPRVTRAKLVSLKLALNKR